MKPLLEYHHVVWDWNGTLLNDLWLCVEVINMSLDKRGMPMLSVDRYREIFDFPVRDYYQRLGFDFEREPFEVVGAEFIREYESRRRQCRLQPHALATVQRLDGAGIGQSVLSAYQQHTLEELVEHFQLRSYFQHLVGLEDAYAHGKLETGMRWIRSLDRDPSMVLMLGDTVHDYEVAQAMGVDCILLDGGHQARERLAACPVPLLSGLHELRWR